MKWLRLLTVTCLTLLALAPTDVAAAPAPQPLSCEIAGIPILSLLSGMSLAKRTVVVEGYQLTLSICAPERESLTAERMLDLLTMALPYLSRHAGVPLRGSTDRQIVLVSAGDLPPYVDGRLTSEGVIELRSKSSEWTVVHEGAHYWANGDNFREPWMIEGYADYLTERAMIDMGSDRRAEPPDQQCDVTPLLSWRNSPLNRCGYTAGAAVFRDLSQAIPEDLFRNTLHHLTDGGVVESNSLLGDLERASGKDLLDLMWRVYPRDEFQALKQQRALWRQLAQDNARASALGIDLPAAIDEAIARRDFEAAGAWLAPLAQLLPAAETVVGRCTTLALTCTLPWQRDLSDLSDLAALQAQIQAAQALLDQYEALRQHARSSKIAIAASLTSAVAAFTPQAGELLRQARQSLAAGEAVEQRCGHLDAACPAEWRALWSSGAFQGSAAAIDELDGVLNRVEKLQARCEGFADACRDLWFGDLRQGRLAVVGKWIDSGNAVFDRAAATERRCDDLRTACRSTWVAGLRDAKLDGAVRALATVDDLITKGHAIERRCAGAGLPCQEAWRVAYRQSADTQAGLARIAAVATALPTLQAAAEIAAPAAERTNTQEIDPHAPIAEMQQAFAAGDLQQAQAIAGRIIRGHERARMLASVFPVAMLLGLAVLLAGG
ncbi:MAG TPA: hypothetical protein VF897_19185, partial [Roseiflexaceae bacterium]